jgi:hypothetical protein
MTSIRIATVTAMGLALSACATTAPAPKGNDAQACFAQDFTCKAAGAKTADLASIATAPARYAGQCVSVAGFAKNDRLYRDAGDAIKPAGHPNLLLQWQDKALERRLQLGPSFVTVTGRVRPCARRRAMAAEAPGADADWACSGSATALTVSKAAILPTSMD